MKLSISKIAELFSIENSKAKELKEILNKKAFNRDAENSMDKINAILEGYGIESIRGTKADYSRFWQDTVAIYVNMGDTYNLTIVYETSSARFHITTWGDFVERKMKKYGIE